MKHKDRLDKLIFELGLADTRTKAQALIMAGKVRVNGQVITKSGAMFEPSANITVDNVPKWAGRGALKLLRAFDVFGLDVAGKACADFGASTGGFTDVLLSKGARRVYAVDVGYGQLIWRLASDPRVIVMDRTNARYLTRSDFPERVDFAGCDVSFISLRLILPVLDDVVSGDAVVLIKPQFEAGRDKISRGVIRDKAVHVEVIEEILSFIRENTRFIAEGLTYSPVRGQEGNIEFLCHIAHEGEGNNFSVHDIVDEAHEKTRGD
ncbi:MAG: TlyA family RNA methyltransferase [Synergistaceae bacterium]|nr:TlyA family RNA methyltransferase [Synergistaceae bacterium]MBQ7169614.1 TlyA family RNA methyltransferase [Synergistaceae bacterium]